MKGEVSGLLRISFTDTAFGAAVIPARHGQEMMGVDLPPKGAEVRVADNGFIVHRPYLGCLLVGCSDRDLKYINVGPTLS